VEVASRREGGAIEVRDDGEGMDGDAIAALERTPRASSAPSSLEEIPPWDFARGASSIAG